MLIDYPNPYQRSVAEFHRAFGLPDHIDTPGPLPLDRIELRLGLIHEEGVVELNEAIAANDEVAMIDALVDTMYVAYGALVEMGQDVPYDPDNDSAAYGMFDFPLIFPARGAAAGINLTMGWLRSNLETQDIGASVHELLYFVDTADQVLKMARIDFRPYFYEVHRANMSKLGADGKPIHSRGVELDGYPEGKVLKGPDYSPPDLHSIYLRTNTPASLG